MMLPDNVIIVGAGQAGLQTAEALRTLGYAGAITLLGNERYGPYHRPPLSKAWLAGQMDVEQLAMRSPEVLARKNIDIRTCVQVVGIHTSERLVRMADGSALRYDALVLATGAFPRMLDVPGGNAEGVLTLRSMDDARAIAQRIDLCANGNLPMVVIGGGFIGLEVAASARKKGIQVTVLEAAPCLLGRVLAPMLSEWFAELHRKHGVNLVTNARISSINTHSDGLVSSVQMQDGTTIPAGLVVVGVGVLPNDALARDAGLVCDRGIVVDACARTSDPHVFAAGDCTARSAGNGTLLRLESVQNAIELGKSAAAAVMGQDRPFDTVPWFWSDQYDVKLQIAGLSTGADRWEIQGDPATGSFSVYQFRGERLLAVDSVNDSKLHLQARKRLADDHGQAPVTMV